MKNQHLPAWLVIAFAVFIFSCKKDEVTSENTEQKLSFHLHTNAGPAEANYNDVFADATGRQFNLSDFRYYLSNIVLIKSDNSEYALGDLVLLVDPENQDYELGEVPVGDYKGLKFLFGLDSVTNHSDPTIYPAGSPLAIQSPGIHWDWNSGYIFMKVEGLCDTTLAATGPIDFPFFVHLGLDDLAREVDFSNHPFSVKSGEDKELVLEFDLVEALEGVDLRTENVTHTFNDLPLATKIADNIADAFHLE